MPNNNIGSRTSPIRGGKQPIKPESKKGKLKKVLTPIDPNRSIQDGLTNKPLHPASYYRIKLMVDGRHFYTGKGDRVKPPNPRFKRGLLEKHIKAKEALEQAKIERDKYGTLIQPDNDEKPYMQFTDEAKYYLWQDKMLQLEGEIEATLQPRDDILFNKKNSTAKVYELAVAEWFRVRECRIREEVDGHMALRKGKMFKFFVTEHHN